jgi:ABC-type nickel/cobalt efflux system permease component RcnA
MIAALRTEFLILWHTLAEAQRATVADSAEVLRSIAATGDRGMLVTFAPVAVVIGAAHALTPGYDTLVHAAPVARVLLVLTGAGLLAVSASKLVS